MKILTVKNKKDERFLRKGVSASSLTAAHRSELKNIVKDMRLQMKAAEGVGLSANQIGLNARLFVAEVNGKFYAIFNPRIVKAFKEIAVMEEGCLSVPKTYGPVERPEKITLEGQDVNGKKVKIKAWGMLARVFQHEVDHLDGKLFIDRISGRR